MEAFRENKARIRKIAEVCRKYKLGNYKHVNTNTSSTFTIKYPPTPQYSVFYYDLWVYKLFHLIYSQLYLF